MSSDTGRRLPPSEVDCKWWKSGYCARGTTCYYRHDEAMAGVDNKKAEESASKGKGKGKGKAKSKNLQSAEPIVYKNAPSTSTANPTAPSAAPDQQTCAICFETPNTYGLLVNCDHAFCLECIRTWRASTTAENDLPSNDELKKTSKTCPMCRCLSEFVIPSFVFPAPTNTRATEGQENPAKKEIVDRYLSKLKTIPCRYFEQSIKGSRSASSFRPKCHFGNGCHYAHTHPITNEPYIFSEEDLHRMHRRPKQDRTRFLEQMSMIEMLFNDFQVGYDSDGDDEGWMDDDDGLEDFLESNFLGMGYNGFDDFDHEYNYGSDWD